jgi:hypothetical protein
MKRVWLFTTMIVVMIFCVGCKKNTTHENDYVPPKIYAEVEIIEINGHELELKVVESKTDFCKKNDIIYGELKEYDSFYKAYNFKVGDVVIIQSQPWSVTDKKIEFDFLMPVDEKT